MARYRHRLPAAVIAVLVVLVALGASAPDATSSRMAMWSGAEVAALGPTGLMSQKTAAGKARPTRRCSRRPAVSRRRGARKRTLEAGRSQRRRAKPRWTLKVGKGKIGKRRLTAKYCRGQKRKRAGQPPAPPSPVPPSPIAPPAPAPPSPATPDPPAPVPPQPPPPPPPPDEEEPPVEPDTTPPQTTITTRPSSPSSSTSASFAFTSSEAGTFRCRLDSASFAACQSPRAYSGLSPGSHRFEVQAVDVAANVDATPATWTWTVEPPGDPPVCMPPLGTFDVDSWPPGCWRPYGESSPFNQALPANPRVHPDSAAIVTRTRGFGAPGNLVAGDADGAYDYSHPSYYAKSTDPLFTLHCTADWGTCPIEGHQIRIPRAARAAGGGDAHMTVIDAASGWEYDLWGYCYSRCSSSSVRTLPSGGGHIYFEWGGRTRVDGDGRGTNATAAHFGLQAGIIRAQELQAGQINHALFLVVKCTSGSHVYPALGSGAGCPDKANAPPGGLRFQLAYSDAEIAALSAPPWKKAIVRALAHYGAYVGDTGGSGFNLQFESGSTYTSFGRPDAMVTFASSAAGVSTYDGNYVFNIRDGIDWSRLRVIDPCVAQRTC